MARNGKLIIVPDHMLAPIIRTMFERYATGNYSLKEIAKLARADGLTYRKSGFFVPASTIHKILRNRVYCGRYDYNGITFLDGRHSRRPKKRTHEFAFADSLPAATAAMPGRGLPPLLA